MPRLPTLRTTPSECDKLERGGTGEGALHKVVLYMLVLSITQHP